MSKPSLLRISIGLLLLLLPSLSLSAQGTCLGLGEETAISSGDAIEGTIARHASNRYSFDVHEDEIWRFDVLSSGFVEIKFYSPTMTSDYHPAALYEIDTRIDELYSTAYWMRFEGSVCMTLRHTSNDDEVNFSFTLTHLRSRNGRLQGTDSLTTSYGYNIIGNYYFVQDDYEAAREYYRLALDIDDSDEVIWANLCSADFRIGDYEDAINHCTTSLRYRRRYDYALDYRGAAYAALGRYDEALLDYQLLQSMEPDEDNWPFSIGIAYLFVGDAPAALEAMDNYVHLSDDSYEDFWYGLAALNAGEYEDAIDDFQEAIDDTEFTPSYEYLFQGVAYQFLGDEDASAEAIRTGDSQIWLNDSTLTRNRYLALSYLVQGNFDSSRRYFEDMLRDAPLSHHVRFDRLYLTILARLFPEQARYTEMLDWLNGEVGIESS